MNEHQVQFVQEMNEAIRECERFLFITRCSDLQQEALDTIRGKATELAQAKAQAIEQEDEYYANILLGLQCVTAALMSELRMYMALKAGDPDAAWDHLIEAQDALAGAARTDEGFKHCRTRRNRLHEFEKLVFPLQVFMSAGTIVKELKCSICNEDYHGCDHLVGLPYMGKLCGTIVTSADLDHIAIVDHPADKRCRITSFSSKGVQRNCMTLRAIGLDAETTEGGE